MKIKCVDSLDAKDLAGKRVLVRVDFNVPLEAGEIQSDQRMRAALPTLEYLLNHQAQIVLMSHLGRPDGQVVEYLRLKPVGEHLQKLLGQPVCILSEAVGDSVKATLESADANVFLLENTRFYDGETDNDPEFSRQLAELGDLYVNDAFGAAHRAHASTAGVAAYLPAYAGLLMQREISALNKLLDAPEHPFVAVIGGAKVSSKLGVLENLLDAVDMLVIGGAMAFTFLAAQGRDVGQSLVEPELYETALSLLAAAKQSNTEIILPIDSVMAESKDAEQMTKVVCLQTDSGDIGKLSGVDIGPDSIAQLKQKLQGLKTILWNGPMGVFENPCFAKGTEAVAEILAEATDQGAYSVVGGGDSVAAVEKLGFTERFSHISTGGGASLEFLEGKTLPGIAVLKA